MDNHHKRQFKDGVALICHCSDIHCSQCELRFYTFHSNTKTVSALNNHVYQLKVLLHVKIIGQ